MEIVAADTWPIGGLTARASLVRGSATASQLQIQCPNNQWLKQNMADLPQKLSETIPGPSVTNFSRNAGLRSLMTRKSVYFHCVT